MSLTTALRGFQRAHNLTDSGHVDDPTRAALAQWDRIPSTRTITIDADFAAGPFNGPLPHEPEAQARLTALGYADLIEKLAERYHTTPDTLRALNPAPGFARQRRRADHRAEHSSAARWKRGPATPTGAPP